MLPFDFTCPTRIVYGPGTIAQLGSLAAEFDIKRVLLVSDRGIIAAGHTPRGIDFLQRAGLNVTLFDGVDENPTTSHVNAGLAVAKGVQPEMIVGLGGGSSMDCAKGINFLYSCGGRMQDYWGQGKATGPLLPMIAVPTTAGTGSETQSYALVADAETGVKMACGDKRAAFRIAILDPELTLTQPPRVTALTGVDALAHAIESYVTRRRSEISLIFAREAWRHLAPNVGRVLAEPHSLEARGAMQIGAALAGLAIEQSMLGAAHALANPLTASFKIVHGEAIAIVLPHVIHRNGEQVEAWYGELTECVPVLRAPGNNATATEAIASFAAQISHRGGLAGQLSQCGVPRGALPQLAAAATQQWTGKFNPVEFSFNDYLSIYEAAY